MAAIVYYRTDVGCSRILTDKANYLKVAIKSSHDIADKIINLYMLLLKKISTKGFKTIKNESWGERVDLFENLLLN